MSGSSFLSHDCCLSWRSRLRLLLFFFLGEPRVLFVTPAKYDARSKGRWLQVELNSINCMNHLSSSKSIIWKIAFEVVLCSGQAQRLAPRLARRPAVPSGTPMSFVEADPLGWGQPVAGFRPQRLNSSEQRYQPAPTLVLTPS